MGNIRGAIAVCQTEPVPGDVRRNITQHLHLARLAADMGARVLVFPELSLTGYEIDAGPSLAFAMNDQRLEPLVTAARNDGLTLIAGAPVRLDSTLHIGAIIIAPDGSVDVYTKHHLGAFTSQASCDGVVPPAERTRFEPGNRSPLVQLEDGAAALAICADTGRPAHAASAAERGATAYLAGMFVIPSEFGGEAARLEGAAVRHSMVVAMANYGGPSGGLAAAGRSGIWSETGALLVQLEPAGTGVGVATRTAAGWEVATVMVQ